MSDADDALLGRTMREYSTAKKDLAALETQIRNIGDLLRALGGLLAAKDGIPSVTTLEPLAAWNAAKDLPGLNRGQLAALLDQYQDRRKTLAELKQQLADLGFTV